MKKILLNSVVRWDKIWKGLGGTPFFFEVIEGREDLAHDEEKESLRQSRHAYHFLLCVSVSWRIFSHLPVVCMCFKCVFASSFVNSLQFILLFSCSVVSDSLWPHGLQYARPPCPSPSPGACSNLCPLSRWCHPTISSSVVPFSSHLQSFPESGSFQMSLLLAKDLHF